MKHCEIFLMHCTVLAKESSEKSRMKEEKDDDGAWAKCSNKTSMVWFSNDFKLVLM